METKYFSISSNENVSSKKLGDLIVKEFGSNADGICVTEIAKKESLQPTVPIQFVWHDGVIMRESAFLSFFGKPHESAKCTVEQIGAVLYVRGE